MVNTAAVDALVSMTPEHIQLQNWFTNTSAWYGFHSINYGSWKKMPRALVGGIRSKHFIEIFLMKINKFFPLNCSNLSLGKPWLRGWMHDFQFSNYAAGGTTWHTWKAGHFAQHNPNKNCHEILHKKCKIYTTECWYPKAWHNTIIWSG